MTAVIPTSIGKYRVERELGKGASGTVYLCHDGYRNISVAIKQIHPHLLADASKSKRQRQMLHNEAVLAGRLNHPHIVALIDVDEEANPPYLVFEYVNGKSLGAFTSSVSLLPVTAVLDIAFKCCNALEYAHKLGLVHRDIKPANLLLREDGEVKLTDFGIAISSQSDLTQVAGLVGSPSYMSPEQIRDDPLTHQADMFSLGVVIYELLTGQRPFKGDSDYATIFKISSETPVSLRVLRPELSDKLDVLMARALAKNPTDRFPSWGDFADALVDVNRDLPKLASRSTESEHFQQLRRMDFFKSFTDVTLWETLRMGKRHFLQAGSVLIKEGTAGESFYMLLAGRASVSRKGWALSKLRAGVSIGEMVYLQQGNGTRTATVTAETDIVVLKIHGASLHQASAELQASFDKAFIKLLVSRLTAANKQLAEWDSPSEHP